MSNLIRKPSIALICLFGICLALEDLEMFVDLYDLVLWEDSENLKGLVSLYPFGLFDSTVS